jgi:hypothetical protein
MIDPKFMAMIDQKWPKWNRFETSSYLHMGGFDFALYIYNAEDGIVVFDIINETMGGCLITKSKLNKTYEEFFTFMENFL